MLTREHYNLIYKESITGNGKSILGSGQNRQFKDEVGLEKFFYTLSNIKLKLSYIHTYKKQYYELLSQNEIFKLLPFGERVQLRQV